MHRTFLGPGKYDWEFADLTFADLKRRDITPIVDLCHFGVPDWIGNFQNPDFPQLFANYAARLRRALSLGAALHAGQRDVHLRGLLRQIWLVERADDGRPRLRHRAQAHRQGQRAGDARDPEAARPTRSSSSSESLGIFPRRQPGRDPPGRSCSIRAASCRLDLNYGRRVDSEMYEYLLGQRHDHARNITSSSTTASSSTASWATIITAPTSIACSPTGTPTASGEVFGYTEITRQYYNRYRLPVMHTETNLRRRAESARRRCHWLWKEWANVLRLRNVGIPTVGFTWYSLTDQVDWDTALREQNGNVNRARPVRSRPQHPQRRHAPTSN